jgi:hypothetical protein
MRLINGDYRFGRVHSVPNPGPESGLAERYSAALCSLPLDLTSGPGFATDCNASLHSEADQEQLSLPQTTILRNVGDSLSVEKLQHSLRYECVLIYGLCCTYLGDWSIQTPVAVSTSSRCMFYLTVTPSRVMPLTVVT